MLNYMTFTFLSITNYFLLRYIKSRNLSNTAKVEIWKHLIISGTFAVSYLYKGIYTTLHGFSNVLNDFESNYPLGWSIVFFGYILLGELVPLSLLFNY